MLELSRWLFVAGGLPTLLLGLAHALATPRRIRYSFRIPIAGIAPSSACFVASWLLRLAAP